MQREIQEKTELNCKIAEFKLKSKDPVYLAEHVFRVRDNKGKLGSYIMTEPHKRLMRSGILGDKTALYRIINKGRQLGFSIYQGVENLLIAQAMPLTNQYYIATQEKQAKSWLKKIERLSLDSRLWFDGSRIIDIDTVHSSLLQKTIRHLPKENRRLLEESYITGLAASPGGVQGETAINVTIDEFAWMVQRRNQQREIYEAVKYFVSQGGQLSIQSTPFVSSDFFWETYTHAEERMFTPFYCPTIENWKKLDLNKDLREQNCIIPYPWVNINDLEKARRDDITYFKQRCLGIPADVMHRFLDPIIVKKWAIAEPQMSGLPGKRYGMTLDVAQERDLTAILVAEMYYLNGVPIIEERLIDESQEDYKRQADKAAGIARNFQLDFVGIDTTGGHGRGIRDILKYKVAAQFKDFEYASKIKVPGEIEKVKLPNYMALLFKRMLLEGRYRLLNNPQAIQHCLNVESLLTPSGDVKYSGKKNGRDDHFWAKVEMCYAFFGVEQSGMFHTIGSSSFVRPKQSGIPKQRRTQTNGKLGSRRFLHF